MTFFWRILRLIFLGRALARGPGSFARYAARRQGRQIVATWTRGARPRRR